MNRPYFHTLGPALADLILAGDEAAYAEGKHRTNRKVRAAMAKVDARNAQAQATPAPTPAPTPARKTGAGSRGGDPKKYARGLYATAQGHDANTPAWWEAYKSAEAKAFAAEITTHEQAKEAVLALVLGK